jgi:hypothetical protein
VAVGVGWLVAWQIGSTAYETTFGITVYVTDSFLPLLAACTAAIAVMALLLPAPGPPTADVPASTRPQATG